MQDIGILIIFGEIKSFTTLSPDTNIYDIDSNVYPSVTIGTQEWMVENLKVTKLNDGTAIPLVTNDNTWAGLSTSAYCWYNNDKATYGDDYGALYNWYTVNTDKLCPTGWHVPNNSDWTTLLNSVGGDQVAAIKLKEAGTAHWTSPNTGATNESGFTALPGGQRDPWDFFTNVGYYGYWWSATANSSIPDFVEMGFDVTSAPISGHYKEAGMSVRCVKD